jgi:pyruvate/2-oxoglutarate dehydrogenase complex dihydrolipoamide acyltransferase (E2) component
LLAEVQVDKVSVEVPAPAAGVIHMLVDEEAEVPQGTPIALYRRVTATQVSNSTSGKLRLRLGGMTKFCRCDAASAR